MTTKAPGGKITGLLALTFEAQEALNVRDPVHIIGDYEVERADGTRPIPGHVSVANKGRDGRTYPASIVPGDCTVEARGFYVMRAVSAGAIEAGLRVAVNAAGGYVEGDGILEEIGTALTGTDGAADEFDILVD